MHSKSSKEVSTTLLFVDYIELYSKYKYHNNYLGDMVYTVSVNIRVDFELIKVGVLGGKRGKIEGMREQPFPSIYFMTQIEVRNYDQGNWWRKKHFVLGNSAN